MHKYASNSTLHDDEMMGTKSYITLSNFSTVLKAKKNININTIDPYVRMRVAKVNVARRLPFASYFKHVLFIVYETRASKFLQMPLLILIKMREQANLLIVQLNLRIYKQPTLI